ncbi:hypothetical protein ACX0G7_16500 [Flavitalea antarctica]
MVLFTIMGSCRDSRYDTKRLGKKAIEELKKVWYTKEDFLKWRETYKEAVKNLEGMKKNTSVQQARLESVEKILEIWK